MNTLLIFFAFPISVIVFSIVLQKLLNNPLIIAAIIFAVFIVITFAAFDETFLIATLAYTLLAFITALIVDSLCACSNNEFINTIQNFESSSTSTNSQIKENPDPAYNIYRCKYNKRYRHF